MSELLVGAQTEGVAPDAPEPERRAPKKLGVLFWICSGWIVLNFLAAVLANVLPLDNPDYQNYSAVNKGPSGAHWLGTDDLGRDILSRVIFGSRISLEVGFGAIGIGLIVGGTLGMYAAYRRGRIDTILSASSYVLLAFPPLVAVIAIVTFWGRDIWKIIIVIGVASIPLLFRIMRASCLTYATRDFVTAAKAQGASDARVLIREILPNVAPAAASFSLIGVATVIVLEGSLAFLGLSVSAPTPSWGNMLNEGTSYLFSPTNLSLTLSPAIAMFLFLLSLNLVGDRIRQYFDVAELKL